MGTWAGGGSQPPGDYIAGLPASVQITDWVPAGGQGYWLLGSDGGVFAVGGAPFFGSAAGQSAGKFERITHDNATGGYTLADDQGRTFGGNGEYAPPPPPPRPPVAPLAPDSTVVSSSASASVGNTLKSFGLNMSAATIDKLTNSFRTGGQDQFYEDLTQTDEYNQRFPAMKALNAAGHHIDENTYIQTADTYTKTMNSYGIPAEMQSGLADKFIGGLVSPAEVNSRIQDAAQAAYQSPPETRAALASLYGITGGDLISFFLDPAKSTNLMQQRVLSGGTIAGVAQASGYGALTKEEAEGLGTDRGVTAQQAEQGFGQLAHEGELFNPIEGGEATITRQQQLGAEFGGDQASRDQILNQAARRKATFQAGGDYAAGSKGVTGLGTAGQ